MRPEACQRTVFLQILQVKEYFLKFDLNINVIFPYFQAGGGGPVPPGKTQLKTLCFARKSMTMPTAEENKIMFKYGLGKQYCMFLALRFWLHDSCILSCNAGTIMLYKSPQYVEYRIIKSL